MQNKKIYKSNSDDKTGIILFFFYPFGAFIHALGALKSKTSQTVIFYFYILFCYTFIAQNTTADSFFYVNEFKDQINISTSGFLNIINQYFTFDSDIKDIYTVTVNFLVSRVTDNYHILFALYGVIFTWFFLKSLLFFINREEYTKSIAVYFLVFLFFFSNSIFNINGVRFWTAAWVAVYSIFELVVNKKLQFLWVITLIPLIHISYFSIWIVLVIYFFSLKYDKFWITIFIVSFFVSNISIELIQKFNYLGPSIGQYMANTYAGNDYLANKTETFVAIPLYAKILFSLPRYFLNYLILLFCLNLRIVKADKLGYSVFLFLLIWMSFVNLSWSVPSYGTRFIALSIPFICYICLVYYRKIPILRRSIYFVPIIYAYAIFQWIRVMITVTDPYLLFSVFPHLLLKNLFNG